MIVRAVSTALLASLLGGCGAPVPPELPSPPPEPLLVHEVQVAPADLELAILVARALQERPGDPPAILAAHELNTETWERLLVEIAASPSASERYAQALVEHRIDGVPSP